MKTIKMLEKKLQDAIRSGVKQSNMIFSNNLVVGSRVQITNEVMGFSVGKFFFTPRGAAEFGKLSGETTGLLDKASAVFKFMRTDSNGKAILHEITSYPVL
ncbi:hypothetical protein [uncultured Chryseobacterium sp.]|uniref:hypothetical protein n=1 Tax=uncultured Chryseobacterium sp. TaxID=259322 RepID=UPI00374801B0